jgi:leucyl-tRNA synthetase
MSKSKGNTVDPEEYIERYGADAVRLYLPFLGPVDQDAEWRDAGFEGMVRFLHRLWRVALQAVGRGGGVTAGTPLARKAHATIAKVSDDIGRRFAMNTPIAAVMELVNEVTRRPDDAACRFAIETAVSLIQPYAPHIAEELWQRLGHERLWEQAWPEADPSQLERDTFELVVQVNGKVRDRFEVEADLSDDELVARATASPRVQAHIDGGRIRKTIVVPRKLVNLVVA